jgi:Protein of unknown function (DUF3618)
MSTGEPAMTAREGEAGPPERTTAGQAVAPGIARQADRQAADGQRAEPLTGRVAAPPKDARQLALEIERTREQLGETVQELLSRADVKARAVAKATEVSARYKTTVAQARSQAAAAGKAGKDQLTKGANGARQHWMPLAVATGVVIIGYLAVRYGRCDRRAS